MMFNYSGTNNLVFDLAEKLSVSPNKIDAWITAMYGDNPGYDLRDLNEVGRAYLAQNGYKGYKVNGELQLRVAVGCPDCADEVQPGHAYCNNTPPNLREDHNIEIVFDDGSWRAFFRF